LMFIGLILTALGMLGISLSTEVWMLGSAVTLMGLGMGLFNPSNLGCISLSTDSHDQGKVMGVAQSFSALGRILGPLSGGFVYGHLGMRFPFILAATVLAIGLFVLVGVRKLIPNTKLSKKSAQFSKIGEFQLTNLLTNPIQFLMLDLRSENKAPYIRKSQIVTLENVKDVVSQSAISKDQAIVIVCQDGKASEKAAEIISGLGYINVVVLEGGTKVLSATNFA